MRNTQLLNDIASVIRSNPDHHDQNQWFDGRKSLVELNGKEFVCGTTQCIAGWAIALSENILEFTTDGALIVEDDSEAAGQRIISLATVQYEARDALGLNPNEALELFHAGVDTNKQYDWHSLLIDIAEGAPIALAMHENELMGWDDYEQD